MNTITTDDGVDHGVRVGEEVGATSDCPRRRYLGARSRLTRTAEWLKQITRAGKMQLAVACVCLLLLTPAPADGAACDGEGATGKQVVVSGACEQKSFLNGAFTLQGTTQDGKEYFVNRGHYLYYDSNCGGDVGTAPAQWMFADKPSTTAAQDLAGDGGTCS